MTKFTSNSALESLLLQNHPPTAFAYRADLETGLSNKNINSSMFSRRDKINGQKGLLSRIYQAIMNKLREIISEGLDIEDFSVALTLSSMLRLFYVYARMAWGGLVYKNILPWQNYTAFYVFDISIICLYCMHFWLVWRYRCSNSIISLAFIVLICSIHGIVEYYKLTLTTIEVEYSFALHLNKWH